jgi:hypothetical protein
MQTSAAMGAVGRATLRPVTAVAMPSRGAVASKVRRRAPQQRWQRLPQAPIPNARRPAPLPPPQAPRARRLVSRAAAEDVKSLAGNGAASNGSSALDFDELTDLIRCARPPARHVRHATFCARPALTRRPPLYASLPPAGWCTTPTSSS